MIRIVIISPRMTPGHSGTFHTRAVRAARAELHLPLVV